MRRRWRRRRPYSTFGFWFVIIGGCVLVAAWKLDLIPIEIGEAETGTIAAPEQALSADAGGAPRRPGDLTNESDADVNVDPIVFGTQTEPAVEESDAAPGSAQNGNLPTAAAGTATLRRWDDPSVPVITPQLPLVADSSDGTPQLSDIENAAAWRDSANESPSIVQTAETKEVPATDEATGTKPGVAVVDKDRIASREAPALSLPDTTELGLRAIDQLIESGDDVAAHREMSNVYWNRPELRPAIQERIEATAQRIYFSPQPHYMIPHVVQPGDQLRKIATKYQLSWQYLAKLNRIEPRRMQAGQKLKVVKGPFSAMVDLSDFELTVHSHGYFVRKYRVGVGRDDSSPTGTFAVQNKVIDPQYTDPDGNVIASGAPNNPLGKRWIDIGDGFGIHGTIQPNSIGRAESRGCIRMLNEDVEEVYDLLTIESEVVIRP